MVFLSYRNIFKLISFILFLIFIYNNQLYSNKKYLNWNTYKCNNILIRVPGELNSYKIIKKDYTTGTKGTNYCTLRKKRLTINIFQKYGNVSDYIKRYRKDYESYGVKAKIKQMLFNNIKVYFHQGIAAMDSSLYYIIIFSEESDRMSNISIGLKKIYNKSYTKNEKALLKTILFSTKILKNKTNINHIFTINAPGGLRMRSGPGLGHTTIGVVPNKRKVIFIKTSGPEKTIAGKTGRWTKVKWKGKTGWVFGGFLEGVK